MRGQAEKASLSIVWADQCARFFGHKRCQELSHFYKSLSIIVDLSRGKIIFFEAVLIN